MLRSPGSGPRQGYSPWRWCRSSRCLPVSALSSGRHGARTTWRAPARRCARRRSSARPTALFVFADGLARIMTVRESAAGFTADYLRIVGWSLAGYGMIVTANAALTARSRAGWAMALSFGRIAVIYIPLAWLGVLTFGYDGILAAAVMANLGALWGALVFSRAGDIGPLDLAVIRNPANRISAFAAGRNRQPGKDVWADEEKR